MSKAKPDFSNWKNAIKSPLMKKWILVALIFPCLCKGEIVFTDISVGMYPDNSRYELDINNDGIFEFDFYNSVKNVGGFFNVTAAEPGVSGGAVVATTGLYHTVAYELGAEIGAIASEGRWVDDAAINGYDVYYNSGGPFQVPYGQFFFTNAYIGVSFVISNQTHYGWIQIENNTPFSGGAIEGFAYETTPGASIIAGAVPEPSSVFLVFLGAFTLWGLKFRKDRRATLPSEP